MTRPIISCPATDETRALVSAAWAEYHATVTDLEGPTDEWDKRLIRQAIRAMALQGRPFSANDFRDLLPDVKVALISGQLIAAQWDGWLRRVGKTPSTLKSTKGHDINVYAATAAFRTHNQVAS